jgi:hypothetical protein
MAYAGAARGEFGRTESMRPPRLACGRARPKIASSNFQSILLAKKSPAFEAGASRQIIVRILVRAPVRGISGFAVSLQRTPCGESL